MSGTSTSYLISCKTMSGTSTLYLISCKTHRHCI
ncbi:hypothetical protein F383_14311 [Gossypium arboreum]|uniref:Uncharacterized protein n=1 Tax=Gossypium arboreum TaxID=29729 RepID=A0A0B0NEZ1_GOSAR|nr:hypothetical protein F383_14311 [Gossypium arboreum]